MAAAEVRRQLATLRRRHAETIEWRDALAFDAVNDASAAERYLHHDNAAAELARQVQLLAAALPEAEAMEAEAARHAEAAALQQRIEDFDRATAEARCFVDSVLERLANAEELTIARDFGRRLSQEAAMLHHATGEGRFRRPIDPIDEIRAALTHRIERLDRARWAPTSPITLKEKKPA